MRRCLAGEQQQRDDAEERDQRNERDQNIGFHGEHGNQTKEWYP